jgi:hypothetical protein
MFVYRNGVQSYFDVLPESGVVKAQPKQCEISGQLVAYLRDRQRSQVPLIEINLKAGRRSKILERRSRNDERGRI